MINKRNVLVIPFVLSLVVLMFFVYKYYSADMALDELRGSISKSNTPFLKSINSFNELDARKTEKNKADDIDYMNILIDSFFKGNINVYSEISNNNFFNSSIDRIFIISSLSAFRDQDPNAYFDIYAYLTFYSKPIKDMNGKNLSEIFAKYCLLKAKENGYARTDLSYLMAKNFGLNSLETSKQYLISELCNNVR